MDRKREDKIRKVLLDKLLKNYSTLVDLLSKNGIMAELKQRFIEATVEVKGQEDSRS